MENVTPRLNSAFLYDDRLLVLWERFDVIVGVWVVRISRRRMQELRVKTKWSVSHFVINMVQVMKTATKVQVLWLLLLLLGSCTIKTLLSNQVFATESRMLQRWRCFLPSWSNKTDKQNNKQQALLRERTSKSTIKARKKQ